MRHHIRVAQRCFLGAAAAGTWLWLWHDLLASATRLAASRNLVSKWNQVLHLLNSKRCRGTGSDRPQGAIHVGIDTIYKSRGKIPDVFLRGCGVPDGFIAYIGSMVGRPIEYYSCFISRSAAIHSSLGTDLNAHSASYRTQEDVLGTACLHIFRPLPSNMSCRDGNFGSPLGGAHCAPDCPQRHPPAGSICIMAFSQLRQMAVESSLKLNTYCLLRTVAAQHFFDQRASRCIKM